MSSVKTAEKCSVESCPYSCTPNRGLHCIIFARYGKSKKRSRAELESLAKRVRFEEPKTEVQLLTERVCILEKKILDL